MSIFQDCCEETGPFMECGLKEATSLYPLTFKIYIIFNPAIHEARAILLRIKMSGI